MQTNLNTSYVKVQLINIWMIVLTSTHLNTSYVKVQHSTFSVNLSLKEFKYILC